MAKRLFANKLSLVLVSLGLTVSLFLTATSARYSNRSSVSTQTAETYTYTVEHVPVDIQYDSNKYFIAGYAYGVEVYLTSINRVKLDSEINSDTRKFKVVADLRNVAEGTTKVNLEVRDLPTGMTAKISPATMNVTVGLKKTKTFPVEVDTSSIKLAEGYSLVVASTKDVAVAVTSDETTLERISRVVAKLPDDVTLSDDYTGDVILQAVSADGLVLPSLIEPSKTKLTVDVSAITKTLPIKVEMVGKLDSNLANILYKLEQDLVSVQGSAEKLNTLSEVVAKLDVTGITSDTTRTLTLTVPEGVEVTPTQVKAKLSVIPK